MTNTVSVINIDEKITRHRNSLSDQMTQTLIAKETKISFLSFESLMQDIMVLRCEVSFRALEFSKLHATKVNIHWNPSGKKVVKADCAERFKFCNKHGCLLRDPVGMCTCAVDMSLLWDVQNKGETMSYMILEEYHTPRFMHHKCNN